MPRKNVSQRKNASEHIFETAKQCLIRGNGDFEITQVAEEAGVSAGLAYRYYKSKGVLVSAIVRDFYERYNEIANKVYDRDIPWVEREYDRTRKALAFLYSDPLAAVILGPMSFSSEVVQVAGECIEETNRLAIANIRNGIKRGVISKSINPEIAGVAVIHAFLQVAVYALKADIQPKQSVVLRQIWRIVCGALELPEEAKNYTPGKRTEVKR